MHERLLLVLTCTSVVASWSPCQADVCIILSWGVGGLRIGGSSSWLYTVLAPYQERHATCSQAVLPSVRRHVSRVTFVNIPPTTPACTNICSSLLCSTIIFLAALFGSCLAFVKEEFELISLCQYLENVENEWNVIVPPSDVL